MTDAAHTPDRKAPGHRAHGPGEIPAQGWKSILLRVWKMLGLDHVSVVAAGVAFFGLLAIFPSVTAVISIAGLVLSPATVQDQITGLAAMLPQNAAEIIQAQAQQVVQGSDTGAGLTALFSILLALYGASKGVRTLMDGMNIAYEEEEKRNIVVLYAVSLGLTVMLVVGLIAALGISLALPAFFALFGAPAWLETLLTWARWPILGLFAVLGLSLLYRWGPSRADARWRWISPGAVLATLLWVLGTGAFTLYASNFGSYNQTYGALGGVIALLTWLWLSAYIVLLGAELNSEMEHQTAKDTTTGAPEPMGERGAVQADRVAGPES